MRLSILDSAYFTVTMAINLLKLVKRVRLLYVKSIWRTVLYDRHAEEEEYSDRSPREYAYMAHLPY